MPNCSASTNITYTPTGASSPITITWANTFAYAAQAADVIDVPDAATLGTTYDASFGSVAAPALVAFRNLTGQALGVRLNGAVANTYTVEALDATTKKVFQVLPAGVDTTTPLTAITFVLTAAQSGAGTIEVLVFGD